MTFSTGIFLTVVRLFEPFFRLIIIQYVYQFWGEIYSIDQESKEEKEIANDALSTFLSSSLNVELVFIILTSITGFADIDRTDRNSKPLTTRVSESIN